MTIFANPQISIVIVVYNDKERLINCLFSLRKQTYPADKREIIVVDDGSTDGTAALLSSTFSEVKVIRKNNTGVANSRNCGVRKASGRIIAFIDSDCIASPDWLGNIARSLKENDTSIVGGQILHEDNFWVRITGISDFGGFQDWVRKEVNNIPTCNMGVKRELFNQFSFDDKLRGGEDSMFCNRLRKNGHRLLYDPRIKVTHCPRLGCLTFFGRACRYGETFVWIRRLDPTLPHAGFLRFGISGIVAATLGRTFLDWYRLFRYIRESEIKIYEIVPAILVIFSKRLVSLLGAFRGYMR